MSEFTGGLGAGSGGSDKTQSAASTATGAINFGPAGDGGGQNLLLLAIAGGVGAMFLGVVLLALMFGKKGKE
jgi:hypothetical protein